MSFRATLKKSIVDRSYALVFWPTENSFSVVACSRLLDGAAVGDSCTVKAGRLAHKGMINAIGKQAHKGMINAIGSRSAMNNLEEDFVRDEPPPISQDTPLRNSAAGVEHVTGSKKRANVAGDKSSKRTKLDAPLGSPDSIVSSSSSPPLPSDCLLEGSPAPLGSPSWLCGLAGLPAAGHTTAADVEFSEAGFRSLVAMVKDLQCRLARLENNCAAFPRTPTPPPQSTSNNTSRHRTRLLRGTRLLKALPSI